tara:strand:+ start:6232 stop:6717 length:486 start_codon:yes stop_codon:yes gene_type:complete
MQNINFTTNQDEQIVINNVQSLKEGILAAYQPVGFKERPQFIQISPHPNVACGVSLEYMNGFKKAFFKFEVTKPQSFYGMPYADVKKLYSQTDSASAIAKLEAVARKIYGKSLIVSICLDTSYVMVDVTELNAEKIGCLEALLKVSGLKPKPTNVSHVDFG